MVNESGKKSISSSNQDFQVNRAQLISQRLTPSLRTEQVNEQIQGLGLLGSHFGVPGIPASYDYVIVGGGTAGLTLARRLATNSSLTVAVIEAGGFYELDNGNYSEIPADATYWVDGGSARNPLVDWYQFTEPQPVSLRMERRPLLYL